MTNDMWVCNRFPAHWRQTDTTRIRSFDWPAAGVDIPYVFSVTGRCGSTHLASMLSESRACGEPIEYSNEDCLPHFPEAGMVGEYIRCLARERSSNRCFGFKIDYWRRRVLRSLVDIEGLFPPERSVFFLMTRQDIVEQAYSFAVAKATTIWHEYTREPSSNPQAYIPSDSELFREIALIVRSEVGLSRYLERSGRSAIRLTYEQLAQDPESLLRRIGGAPVLEPIWLGKFAGMGRSSRVRKLQYVGRDEQIGSRKRRFTRELASVDACRNDFRYEARWTQYGRVSLQTWR